MARERTESRIRMTNTRREQLLDRCEGKCCHCGCELTLGDNFSIEHVIPLSKGGTNDFKNTVALCKDCNFEKGNDVVSVEFYKAAPKIVYEEIEALLNEYYETTDWLTGANVFRHDRYTIKTQQSIGLPNGKVYFKDAECEMRKMDEEEFEEFIKNIETREVVEVGTGEGELESPSGEGTPFKIIFKGKTVASLFCGLDAKKDRTIFRMVLTISKDINWGPSSRMIIVDCIHEAIKQFKDSVEAKGTKAVVLCCVDAFANDKRAVSVIEALTRIWRAPKSIMADAETNEVVFIRTFNVASFGVELGDGSGVVTYEEFAKKSKLYGGQIRRRINQNAKQ